MSCTPDLMFMLGAIAYEFSKSWKARKNFSVSEVNDERSDNYSESVVFMLGSTFNFSGSASIYDYMDALLVEMVETLKTKSSVSANSEFFTPDGKLRWAEGVIHFVWEEQKVSQRRSGALLKIDVLNGIVTDCSHEKIMEKSNSHTPNIYFQFFV